MMSRQVLLPSASHDLLALLSAQASAAQIGLRRCAEATLHARKSLLLGSLAARLPEQAIAPEIQGVLAAGQRTGEAHGRILGWELDRLSHVFADTPIRPVLLKGAAYFVRDLALARGRLISDVDLLVAHADLPRTEALLREAGFIDAKLNSYDQRYYREWMHELPPLRHAHRSTVVDVHHTILPLTGRVQPDAQALLDAAEDWPGSPFRLLHPLDTVLHCAAHLFQDGDLDNRLRDLVDLDGLIRWACPDSDSAQALLARAEHHQLQDALAYTLRYCQAWLGTPFAAQAPAIPVLRRWGMDRLLPAAMAPTVLGPAPVRVRLARRLLYMRSHWLRMPPLQLFRHLLHKALKRDASKQQNQP